MESPPIPNIPEGFLKQFVSPNSHLSLLIMTLSPVPAVTSQNCLLLSRCQSLPPSLPMYQEPKAHMCDRCLIKFRSNEGRLQHRGENDFNFKVTYHILKMCWSLPTTGNFSSLVFLLVPTLPHKAFFKPPLQVPNFSVFSPGPELPPQTHNFSPFILQPVQLMLHLSQTSAGGSGALSCLSPKGPSLCFNK